jgi:hypothetical protein
MAEPKPLPACAKCDHICEETEDGECWNRMTREERIAFAEMLVAEANAPKKDLSKFLGKWGVTYFNEQGRPKHDP